MKSTPPLSPWIRLGVSHAGNCSSNLWSEPFPRLTPFTGLAACCRRHCGTALVPDAHIRMWATDASPELAGPGTGVSLAPIPVQFASLAPKPTAEGNRCNLKPFEPEVPEKALLLVVLWRPLPLQVVYRSRPGFQWPKPAAKSGWDALGPARRARQAAPPSSAWPKANDGEVKGDEPLPRSYL